MSAILAEPYLNLRPMTEEDLTNVMLIEMAAYSFPWNLRIFQDCLRAGYLAYVLEETHYLLGYGLMSLAVEEAHILNLCVHPDRQRCGHGRRILRYLLDTAKQRQAKTAFLEVRPSNQFALRLYTQMGFNQIGVRKGYYPVHPKKREDALILALELQC